MNHSINMFENGYKFYFSEFGSVEFVYFFCFAIRKMKLDKQLEH